MVNFYKHTHCQGDLQNSAQNDFCCKSHNKKKTDNYQTKNAFAKALFDWLQGKQIWGRSSVVMLAGVQAIVMWRIKTGILEDNKPMVFFSILPSSAHTQAVWRMRLSGSPEGKSSLAAPRPATFHPIHAPISFCINQKSHRG